MNADVKLFETVGVFTGPAGGTAFAMSAKIVGLLSFATYQMLMPFIVMLIWPARNAWLLFGSSQPATPGIMVS